MLQRLTCSRTATAVSMVSENTSGALRAERGVGDGREWRAVVELDLPNWSVLLTG